MNGAVSIIRLPFSDLLLIAAGLGLVLFAAFRMLKGSLSKRSPEEAEPERDWTLPSIDACADLDSPFHRWDPRIKILSLLVTIFCIASITQVPWAALALLPAVAAVLVARIPGRNVLRRLGAMGGFLGMFLIVMPLTVPARSGDTLVLFGPLSWLSFNVRGLVPAGLICLKACAIGLLMEPLLATAPFSTTMHALARLGLPRQMCQMLLLTHRYIYVFHDEMKRMTTGMKARGFRKQTSLETVRTFGNFLGMLLVHSFERTQRVYEAMLSRGYRGQLPDTVSFEAKRSDWIQGAVWSALGIAIFSLDHWWRLPLF